MSNLRLTGGGEFNQVKGQKRDISAEGAKSQGGRAETSLELLIIPPAGGGVRAGGHWWGYSGDQ